MKQDLLPVSPPGVKGRLVVSLYGGPLLQDEPPHTPIVHPARHRTTWVNGTGYQGMEDNDLRGFLDGRFRYGWNQPGQIHVRAGRRDRSPRYGEYELFRILQRWEKIELPPGADILEARICLTLENNPFRPTRVLLYDVRKDWNPGTGGTLYDNVSPPKPGEVWWNDNSWPDQPWGLPGAGYASDSDPQADTGGMPLAEAILQPGDSLLSFSSSRLASYIERELNEARPLLFLIKLDDYAEDLPGSMIYFYSGNHGDQRNVRRRPYLILEWESSCEISTIEKEIHLEYGRRTLLDGFPQGPAEWIAATFIPEIGFIPPVLEMGSAVRDQRAEWCVLSHPTRRPSSPEVLRLTAAVDPVPLGTGFRSELRDTWILTAPPEEQEVLWTFVSPQGEKHRIKAEYQGDHCWMVEFLPDELGPWSYHWTQQFAEVPYLSEEGRFDVIAGDSAGIRAALERLAHEIAGLELESDAVKRDEYMIRFMRLERAALQMETAGSFRGESGRSLLEILNSVRAQWGEAAPDSIPMKANAPIEY
ncbi:MAG: DUF5060 domain-containing protein [Candidatus Eisenbacteria bacterium]|uniref:DUF5060 domain-containing protein n=1 Tax=Eiseniibacteriota bacterium TaxID=2212470 RepID=A0A948WAX0_UNCEI|nr:DUF5060 domain-containing protein [Candidatus Eisenbacteria bacterium]